jgi:hypothetical protein
VVASEKQPAQDTTSTTGEAGISDPVTKTLPDSDVSGTGTDPGVSPGPTRRSSQLGATGDGTRRLIILGGLVLLIGAVVVAFTGRDEPVAVAPSAPPAPGRPRRGRRPGEIDGWEDGIPLAPGKRELARRQAGLSAWSSLDGEPGA